MPTAQGCKGRFDKHCFFAMLIAGSDARYFFERQQFFRLKNNMLARLGRKKVIGFCLESILLYFKGLVDKGKLYRYLCKSSQIDFIHFVAVCPKFSRKSKFFDSLSTLQIMMLNS